MGSISPADMDYKGIVNLIRLNGRHSKLDQEGIVNLKPIRADGAEGDGVDLARRHVLGSMEGIVNLIRPPNQFDKAS
jgi:hypothetical protein